MNSQLMYQRLIGSLSTVAFQAKESNDQELHDLVLRVLSCNMCDQDCVLRCIAELDQQKQRLSLLDNEDVEVDWRAFCNSSCQENQCQVDLWNSLQKLALHVDEHDDDDRPAIIEFIYRCIFGLHQGGNASNLCREMDILSALIR